MNTIIVVLVSCVGLLSVVSIALAIFAIRENLHKKAARELYYSLADDYESFRGNALRTLESYRRLLASQQITDNKSTCKYKTTTKIRPLNSKLTVINGGKKDE